MSNYPVAENITAHLGDLALCMLGATQMAWRTDGITFKIKGSKVFNWIRITLESGDTYKVTFYRLRGTVMTAAKDFDGMHVEQLLTLITDQTGLFTTIR